MEKSYVGKVLTKDKYDNHLLRVLPVTDSVKRTAAVQINKVGGGLIL